MEDIVATCSMESFVGIWLSVVFIFIPTNLSAPINWDTFKAFEVLSCHSSSRLPDGPED